MDMNYGCKQKPHNRNADKSFQGFTHSWRKDERVQGQVKLGSNTATNPQFIHKQDG